MRRGLPLLLLAVMAGSTVAAATSTRPEMPITLAEMRQQVTAPRDFTVSAWVIRADDQCPPCPPGAVCETCQLGIVIADSMDAPAAEGLYLATPQAARFHAGSKYRFRIRYRIERNARGAWQLEGPQLIAADDVRP